MSVGVEEKSWSVYLGKTNHRPRSINFNPTGAARSPGGGDDIAKWRFQRSQKDHKKRTSKSIEQDIFRILRYFSEAARLLSSLASRLRVVSTPC